MNKSNTKGIIILISVLAIISLSTMGINYFKFMKADEEDSRAFTPNLISRSVNGLEYQMTENYLTIRNYKIDNNFAQSGEVSEIEQNDNNIKLYLDFSCFHCKRLFLSNLPIIETLLEQDEDISFDFILLNYFGSRSTTNWSENSSSIMALIANNYPEHFLEASKIFFQFQPELINGDFVSMNTSIALIKEKTDILFSEDEIADLNDGFYLKWVDDIVNKYASKNNVSALPTVIFNGERLRDPAVELPKTLNSLIIVEENE